MRALIQRVTEASVSVNGSAISSIGPGLLVFLGVTHSDTEATAEKMSQKISALRIFDDDLGRMNHAISEGQEILCISQFTLYGDTRKGNRPSYVMAATPEIAEPLYRQVCSQLGAKKGEFGADMRIKLVNDGPVTLMIEV